ncbi:group 1 truncated hemoglobin [Pseudomethylobacillus aquaticus]|uniref:Group 1 truncated hemoglobin n=1 Tax=Pseudomethylobacillus aquaticus TaxID=2676064 RepID=A0A3N0V0W2_9PROT|nr:group 1 truncated hemoglobin [Pseudomethylobacillus aquaticus]ROH86161.1 group 1 truncated hemoglobin [Pseudomethylobacillus aquaticus]
MFNNVKMKSALAVLGLMLSASFTASAADGTPVPSPNLGTTIIQDPTVFKDFGGKEGLVKIMDDFMVLLIADPRTKPFFDNEKQAFIKAMLVEQMCEILNGGCKYPGRDMKSSHATMRVNREAFNALVEDFQLAMDKHNVPFSSQNKLLAKLAPMYRDIETTTGAASATLVPPVAK